MLFVYSNHRNDLTGWHTEKVWSAGILEADTIKYFNAIVCKCKCGGAYKKVTRLVLNFVIRDEMYLLSNAIMSQDFQSCKLFLIFFFKFEERDQQKFKFTREKQKWKRENIISIADIHIINIISKFSHH